MFLSGNMWVDPSFNSQWHIVYELDLIPDIYGFGIGLIHKLMDRISKSGPMSNSVTHK